jgi:hypothetical protein
MQELIVIALILIAWGFHFEQNGRMWNWFSNKRRRGEASQLQHPQEAPTCAEVRALEDELERERAARALAEAESERWKLRYNKCREVLIKERWVACLLYAVGERVNCVAG